MPSRGIVDRGQFLKGYDWTGTPAPQNTADIKQHIAHPQQTLSLPQVPCQPPNPAPWGSSIYLSPAWSSSPHMRQYVQLPAISSNPAYKESDHSSWRNELMSLAPLSDSPTSCRKPGSAFQCLLYRVSGLWK